MLPALARATRPQSLQLRDTGGRLGCHSHAPSPRPRHLCYDAKERKAEVCKHFEQPKAASREV